jgi:hypothetical protein
MQVANCVGLLVKKPKHAPFWSKRQKLDPTKAANTTFLLISKQGKMGFLASNNQDFCFSILWCSQTENHPQEDLAKFD